MAHIILTPLDYMIIAIWFQAVEAELRGRDIAVVGTNKAVNKLEVHHVTALQDLKGRIVRCDTALGKHTKDLVFMMEELRRLEGQQFVAREKLINDIHRLEAEVTNEPRQRNLSSEVCDHFRLKPACTAT